VTSGRSRTCVLLVDDERALADLMKQYLERFGYQVSVCSAAEEALEQMNGPEGGFGLLISDLTLHGISGQELARRALAIDPELRVLAASGYPFDPETLGAGDRVAFLLKPFPPELLLQSVRRLIGPAASPATA